MLKRLVALIALVVALGVVVSQPTVAPAQQADVAPAQQPAGEHSDFGDHPAASRDPAATTDPAPSGSESTAEARSAMSIQTRSATSTDTGSAQVSAAGGPRAISAQATPSSVLLGTAESFAVLGGSAVTNTGPSVISGDVGVAPSCAVSGFPPATVVNGTIHRCDAVAAQAQADLTTAYNDAAGRIPTEQVATELGGQTLTTGVYDSASGTFGITGALTLDAQGNPDAVFIFQTDSTLITASASRVVLINGAQACNVFWQIGSSATLGTNSSFAGNILALTSITANTGATVDGRLLARNGAVTLDTNTITTSECAIAVEVPGPDEGGPTDDTPPSDDTGGGDGDTTSPGGDTTGGGDGTGGDDGTTGGGGDDATGGGGGDTDGGDGTGGDDGTTGGGDGTPSVGTGGGTGGGESGRNTQNDQSGPSARQRTLPFTGLGVGVLALLGTVMLLLGASLRTNAPGRTSEGATIDEFETSTSET
jgi:hypothetical protein